MTPAASNPARDAYAKRGLGWAFDKNEDAKAIQQYRAENPGIGMPGRPGAPGTPSPMPRMARPAPGQVPRPGGSGPALGGVTLMPNANMGGLSYGGGRGRSYGGYGQGSAGRGEDQGDGRIRRAPGAGEGGVEFTGLPQDLQRSPMGGIPSAPEPRSGPTPQDNFYMRAAQGPISDAETEQARDFARQYGRDFDPTRGYTTPVRAFAKGGMPVPGETILVGDTPQMYEDNTGTRAIVSPYGTASYSPLKEDFTPSADIAGYLQTQSKGRPVPEMLVTPSGMTPVGVNGPELIQAPTNEPSFILPNAETPQTYEQPTTPAGFQARTAANVQQGGIDEKKRQKAAEEKDLAEMWDVIASVSATGETLLDAGDLEMIRKAKPGQKQALYETLTKRRVMERKAKDDAGSNVVSIERIKDEDGGYMPVAVAADGSRKMAGGYFPPQPAAQDMETPDGFEITGYGANGTPMLRKIKETTAVRYATNPAGDIKEVPPGKKLPTGWTELEDETPAAPAAGDKAPAGKSANRQTKLQSLGF